MDLGYLFATGDGGVFFRSAVFLGVLRLATAGVFRKSLRFSGSLFGWISREAGSDSLRHKIHENLWYFLWHSWSFGFNVWVLWQASGPRRVRSLQYEVDLVENDLDDVGRWYLDVCLGFWTTCAFFLMVETVRKDFVQMILHHVFTLVLIVGANLSKQQRPGAVVLLVHDVVDIFLYLAKVLLYKEYRNLADGCFGVFAFLFFACRLVYYPIWIILPYWKYMHTQPLSLYHVLPTMLAGLYGLHVFWGVLIAKMIRAVFKSGTNVEKDCRSEDEDEDFEEEKEKKK